MTAGAEQFFGEALLEGLDEPVRRYFRHAIAPGTRLLGRTRLRLLGKIRVAQWLDFDSVWAGDGRSFSWDAAVGIRRFHFLSVQDGFASGKGSMEVRLRPPGGRLPSPRLLHVENEDTARSGAGRAALEAIWVPDALLPSNGVEWRAERADLIVATWPVPPEHPEIRIRIGPEGQVRSCWSERWRSARDGYQPFGAEVHRERTFDGCTVPEELTVGWGYGTPAWVPFFRCRVMDREPLG